MSVKVIKTADRKPYRNLYYPFQEKYFSRDFVLDPKAYASWSDSPFLFVSLTVNDNGSIGSYASMVLTSKNSYEKLLLGEIQDHEILPFQPGEYGIPYLYWDTFIVENRAHSPYLIKSIFNELETTVRKWELLVTHVYSIAFTPAAARLMRRYFFVQAGVYKQGEKEYPIMISKVADNPYLRAFIPQI
jgi:hypothetical protein